MANKNAHLVNIEAMQNFPSVLALDRGSFVVWEHPTIHLKPTASFLLAGHPG
jgi:hypothetical protein